MDITVYPSKLSGEIYPPVSKSVLHRYLIINYFLYPQNFSQIKNSLYKEYPIISEDVKTTIKVLEALDKNPYEAHLHFNSSGSTLRFMIPLLALLGGLYYLDASEDLKIRPLDAYAPLFGKIKLPGFFSSKLDQAEYCIDPSISSQYVSGMLIALVVRNTQAFLKLEKSLRSKPYVDTSLTLLKKAGAQIELEVSSKELLSFKIHSCKEFTLLNQSILERDWSQAAFYLVAKALGAAIEIKGLNSQSVQGDIRITEFIEEITSSRNSSIDISNTPDLFPILCVLAARQSGKTTRFINTNRLRYKESNRVKSSYELLLSLGVSAKYTEDTFIVRGQNNFRACSIHSCNDHRIAMAGAIAACFAEGPCKIIQAEAVAKSYPKFFEDLSALGARLEVDSCNYN